MRAKMAFPLVEFDPATKAPVPGALVRSWGPGNWSGSADEKLRTMRSGAALQTNQGRRFLIYAVFSDATPSAMARIFQAYRCDYAMLLDMNALEHTYLALYRRSGSQMFVDHLLKGMSEVDKSAAGELVPRFLGYPDNRDFFYVMRRNRQGGQAMRSWRRFGFGSDGCFWEWSSSRNLRRYTSKMRLCSGNCSASTDCRTRR